MVGSHTPTHHRYTHTPGKNTDGSGTSSGEFLPVCRRLAFGSRGPDAGREPRDEVSFTSKLWGEEIVPELKLQLPDVTRLKRQLGVLS